ncbi:hypothetical protein QMK33_08200 [Hymenobacter sp. H14-R3]|uniref:DUF6630 family protein n=1 Tax=Hymenobacter sp. H14-R3 TaxID=3046308 RepID=UPI0024BA7E45|nr:hypothetical protein [Hymenobacter sp. H14-R3]MDJ0365132.1 hypothetical protein [Hymenobacter sp. H14-R3]
MSQANLTRFIQFFTLADEAATQRVEARLALSLGDPTAYQAQYTEELAERDIVTELPAQELRDVALIDALLSADLLWESDWQDQAADTAEGLNDILTQQGRPERLSLASRRPATGPELLDMVQDILEPLGLALVLLSLDSDSYPLSLVADAQAEKTRQLAKELGFTLTVY